MPIGKSLLKRSSKGAARIRFKVNMQKNKTLQYTVQSTFNSIKDFHTYEKSYLTYFGGHINILHTHTYKPPNTHDIHHPLTPKIQLPAEFPFKHE